MAQLSLTEVLRVFGEAPSTTQAAPQQNEQSKLVEVLERELLFLKNQIEQKDKQINNLTLLLETSAQRPEETQSNDTPQHDETPIVQTCNIMKRRMKQIATTQSNIMQLCKMLHLKQ